MNQPTISVRKAWRQYEAGKEYKRRIGLYETVRRNERFYRGDQWHGGDGGDLPKPVFNLIRRIADYQICSIASTDLSIRFTDEHLPFLRNAEDAKALERGLEILSANAAYRWERNELDYRLLRMLTDAAITGDGVLYCYWDPDVKGPQLFSGDIVTEVIDNVNLFVADVNRPDIQSQDYVIVAGRASVSSLRAEAAEAGMGEEELLRICADTDVSEQSGDMAKYELGGEEEAKATYIVKFWREDGKVVFEKSVKDCSIRRARTDCRLYPIAYMNWCPTKNSFHGASPITALIPNQKYVNRAFSLAMKHMMDTAFSKVIYDKSKIPEWSNQVGEAIAAVGGGSIADAVSVVGVGQMQSEYLSVIDHAVTLTKEMMGATESALGNIEASNTSAILALQETSRIPLEQIRRSYYRCVEDMANIWADMMCAYYPSDRLLPYYAQNGVATEAVDFSELKKGYLNARIDVNEKTRYTAAGAQALLDRLLEGGHISPAAYVRHLPAGLLCNRQRLLEDLTKTDRDRDGKEECYDAAE